VGGKDEAARAVAAVCKRGAQVTQRQSEAQANSCGVLEDGRMAVRDKTGKGKEHLTILFSAGNEGFLLLLAGPSLKILRFGTKAWF
jgi:hypothetical protein